MTFSSLKALRQSRNTQGPYTFTGNDCRLTICEYFWRLPRAQVTQERPGMRQIRIEDQSVFWPSEFAPDELAYLYAEVFFPREINPSSYDHPEVPFYDAPWVIDAGACEGFLTHFAFSRGAKRVVAIEPVPTLLPCLHATFDTHARTDCFSVESKALSSAPGTARLDLDVQYLCEAHLTGQPNLQGAAEPLSAATEVSLATLDEIACRQGLTGRGVIKMDIEGAEMEALRGAKDLLRDHKPYLAVAVYHDLENAAACRDIILAANPSYNVEFRGFYLHFLPPRPYILFAY